MDFYLLRMNICSSFRDKYTRRNLVCQGAIRFFGAQKGRPESRPTNLFYQSRMAAVNRAPANRAVFSVLHEEKLDILYSFPG